jgi:hypothetical protein
MAAGNAAALIAALRAEDAQEGEPPVRVAPKMPIRRPGAAKAKAGCKCGGKCDGSCGCGGK